MPKRQSRVAVVNYQQRAKEFAVGDMVYPYSQIGAGVNPAAYSGRVVAVWPAIGMVDVEFPTGNSRFPVEDLQKLTSEGVDPPKATSDTIPGGTGTEPVSAGPKDADPKVASLRRITSRVAQAYVKKALYWGAVDRHYKATQDEIDSGRFQCPKCKDSILRPANYKRIEGRSERLLCCDKCLFLIKRQDIIGHPEYVDDGLDGIMAGGK